LPKIGPVDVEIIGLKGRAKFLKKMHKYETEAEHVARGACFQQPGGLN